MQMVNRGFEEGRKVSKANPECRSLTRASISRKDNLWWLQEALKTELEMQQRWEEHLRRFLCKAQSQRASHWAWESQWAGTAHRAQLREPGWAQAEPSSKPQQTPEMRDKELSSCLSLWWCCLTALSCWGLRESPGSHLRTEIWAETLWNEPLISRFEREFRLKW